MFHDMCFIILKFKISAPEYNFNNFWSVSDPPHQQDESFDLNEFKVQMFYQELIILFIYDSVKKSFMGQK